jgi:hypothetical protein
MNLKPIAWVWGLCLLLTLSLGMFGCPATPNGDDDDADDDDAGPDPDGDEDGDGLTYQQEMDTGGCLDPDNPDSDGDGWNDGEEYNGNFDPCDPNDMPYVGGWGRDDCYDSFASAYVGGDIMQDAVLMDQYGDMLHIRDFCGRAIYMSIGAMW